MVLPESSSHVIPHPRRGAENWKNRADYLCLTFQGGLGQDLWTEAAAALLSPLQPGCGEVVSCRDSAELCWPLWLSRGQREGVPACATRPLATPKGALPEDTVPGPWVPCLPREHQPRVLGARPPGLWTHTRPTLPPAAPPLSTDPRKAGGAGGRWGRKAWPWVPRDPTWSPKTGRQGLPGVSALPCPAPV